MILQVYKKSYHMVSDFSRYCRKIVRIYRENVELMLAVNSENCGISPFHSVSIMCIFKHNFAIFWRIHADNLLVLPVVLRLGVSPPYKFRKNLREPLRRPSCERAQGFESPLG
jgi:hypothetical protein